MSNSKIIFIVKILQNLTFIVKSVLIKFVLRKQNAVFFSPPLINGLMPIVKNNGSLKILSQCKLRATRTPIQITVSTGATLTLSERVFCNDGANLHASNEIFIGADTKIGDNVFIYDTDYHEISPERGVVKSPVIIGKNVWIGANSMILAGSTIGDHSVIAAGSVVRGEIPTRCVAAGIPARVIKFFEANDDWVRN